MKISKAQSRNRSERKLTGWLATTGLAGALLIALPSSIYAQETESVQQDATPSVTRSDTSGTDSTKWGYEVERNTGTQNPPGYRGMERPASLTDSTGFDSGAAAADATSRISQMQRQDSLNQPGQNPPGYRGMESPVRADSSIGQSTDDAAAAAQHAGAKKKAAPAKKTGSAQNAKRDTSTQDSTKWGYQTNRDPEVQNPEGYRGMERPAGLDSATREGSAKESGETAQESQ